MCVLNRLLIDCFDSSEDERVKKAEDPDLSSPRPAPAATAGVAYVSYVCLYALCVCVLMCLCDQPAALCAMTFTEAKSGPINSQAVL